MTSTSFANRLPGWLPWLAVPVLVFLFLVANRAAYKGYFSSDDLDNIAWTRNGSPRMFLEGLATPLYIPQHFRPPGHFVFYALGSKVGLDYRWYVAVVHALHFLNAGLLYLLLRRLNLGPWGALFFAFPMAVFDALWKPMYVFDVWCATFTILTLLQYVSGRTAVSLLCFWLAYKSKENGAMAAFAIVAYECFLGNRNWKRAVPFVALTAWFTGQAVWANRGDAGSEYALTLTAAALWKTVRFYGSRAMLSPWLLAALAGAAIWFRDRRAAFGLATAILLLAPLLFLPGRLFPAYLYAPMAGIAIALGAMLERIPARPRPVAATVLIAIWWGANFQAMRLERNPALAEADLNRAYVAKVMTLPERYPGIRQVLYDGSPPGMHWWGIQAALRLAYKTDDIELKQSPGLFSEPPMMVLSWNETFRLLETAVYDASRRPKPFVQMREAASVFQLMEGWHPKEGDARWSQPVAKVRLWRPAGAKSFELEAAAPENASIEVRLDGRAIGTAAMPESVWRKLAFPIPAAAQDGPATIEWRVSPPHRPGHGDTRVLGVLVRSLGFPPTGMNL